MQAKASTRDAKPTEFWGMLASARAVVVGHGRRRPMTEREVAGPVD